MAYIENFRDDIYTASVFSMTSLSRLYTLLLSQFGLTNAKVHVHSTRRRQKIEAAIPDLTCTSQGRNVIRLFDKDLGNALKKVYSSDSEALQLVKAAQIIRKELFQKKSNIQWNI